MPLTDALVGICIARTGELLGSTLGGEWRGTSLEIAGAYGGLRDFERHNFLGLDVDDSILILDGACDVKKSGARDAGPFTLENIRGDDDVGDACLVFKREKDKSLGCSRTLPSNDAPGNADSYVIIGQSKIGSGENTCAAVPCDGRPLDAVPW
jgi:hypothetical protein